jgi:hypothetical protein
VIRGYRNAYACQEDNDKCGSGHTASLYNDFFTDLLFKGVGKTRTNVNQKKQDVKHKKFSLNPKKIPLTIF